MKHINFTLLYVLMILTTHSLSFGMFSRTSQLQRAVRLRPKVVPQPRQYFAQPQLSPVDIYKAFYEKQIPAKSLMVIPTSKPEEVFEKKISPSTEYPAQSWWEKLKNLTNKASQAFTQFTSKIRPEPSNIFPEFFKEGYGNPFKDKTLDDYKTLLEEHRDFINKVDIKAPGITKTTLLGAIMTTLNNQIKDPNFSLEDLTNLVALAQMVQNNGGAVPSIIDLYDIYNNLNDIHYKTLLLKFPDQIKQIEETFQVLDNIVERIARTLYIKYPSKAFRIIRERVKRRKEIYKTLVKEQNVPPLEEKENLFDRKLHILEEKITKAAKTPLKKVSPTAKEDFLTLINLDPKKIYNDKEINTAFNTAIKKWHPDLNPDNKEEAAEMSKKINTARDEYLAWKQQYE